MAGTRDWATAVGKRTERVVAETRRLDAMDGRRDVMAIFFFLAVNESQDGHLVVGLFFGCIVAVESRC